MKTSDIFDFIYRLSGMYIQNKADLNMIIVLNQNQYLRTDPLALLSRPPHIPPTPWIIDFIHSVGFYINLQIFTLSFLITH